MGDTAGLNWFQVLVLFVVVLLAAITFLGGSADFDRSRIFMFCVFVLICASIPAYKYWGNLPASPDKVAQIGGKVRVAQLENCQVGEWSAWALEKHGPPTSFIERRLEENRPVLNSEVEDLKSVIRSCQDQASQRAEDKHIAAAQKAAPQR